MKEYNKNEAYSVRILSSARLRRCGASVLYGFPLMYNTYALVSRIIHTESRNLNRVNINFLYRLARENTSNFYNNFLIYFYIFHKARWNLQNDSCIIIKWKISVLIKKKAAEIFQRLKLIIRKYLNKRMLDCIHKIAVLCY